LYVRLGTVREEIIYSGKTIIYIEEGLVVRVSLQVDDSEGSKVVYIKVRRREK